MVFQFVWSSLCLAFEGKIISRHLFQDGAKNHGVCLRAYRRLGCIGECGQWRERRAQFEDVLNLTVPLGVTERWKYGYLSLFTCPLNYLRASQALLREEPGSLGPHDIMLFNIRGKNIPVCMGSIPHCASLGSNNLNVQRGKI